MSPRLVARKRTAETPAQRRPLELQFPAVAAHRKQPTDECSPARLVPDRQSIDAVLNGPIGRECVRANIGRGVAHVHQRPEVNDAARTVTADRKSAIDLDGTIEDRKSTRLNSSHLGISYAVFCLKKKKKNK